MRVIRDLDRFQDGRIIPYDVLDAFVVSLELVYRELIAYQTFATAADDNIQEASELVRSTLSTLATLRDKQQCSSVRSVANPPTVRIHRFGRPSFDIQYEQLSYLLENRFTVHQIADMLAVSERTVYRRMSHFSLSVRAHYAAISDDYLDRLVREISIQYPMCGNSQMQGHLLARGLRIQQLRVRESQRRVDPEGCYMRRLFTINRRQYSVPAPRSLWHIDGNHKLIRYILYTILSVLSNLFISNL